MASRKSRNKKRRPTKPVESEGPVDEKPTPEKPKKQNRTRFGDWADRMEETVDDRPPAPWGSFPLGPIAILAGLVFIVIGALNTDPKQLAIGVGLGCLGGLELSIREHFSGFRSHTTLLAGFLFVIVVGLTYYVGTLVLWACLVIGVVVGGLAFWWLRKAFEKASGGLSYKLR